MDAVGQVQLGKKGVTEGFIKTLQNQFKHHKNIKISVLKSCCRGRMYLKEIAKEIVGRLGENYSSRVIGYTIAIKKLRKPAR